MNGRLFTGGVEAGLFIVYHRSMSIGTLIQGWRLAKKRSLELLSDDAGIPLPLLEQIEAGQADPSVSTIAAIAGALGIPPSWLFGSPQSFEYLFANSDEDDKPDTAKIDPVTDHILTGSQTDRSLYVLLTTLMQAGDPKLLRAAEMSLRSLVKQSRHATVPWEQRPSGNFEPPSD